MAKLAAVTKILLPGLSAPVEAAPAEGAPSNAAPPAPSFAGTAVTARRGELLAEQQRAALEGADVVAEPVRVPVDMGEIFRRTDGFLRDHRNSALLAMAIPREDHLVEIDFWIWQIDLTAKSVREIPDLVALARALGVLEEVETAVPRWSSLPAH